MLIFMFCLFGFQSVAVQRERQEGVKNDPPFPALCPN